MLTEGEWIVRVHTASEKGSGTNACVFMVLYGGGDNDANDSINDDFNDTISLNRSDYSGIEKYNIMSQNKKLPNKRNSIAQFGKKKKDVTYKKTQEIKLHHENDPFETGKIDEFSLTFEKVGKPIKLRVWYDNAGSFAAWKLDKVFNRFNFFKVFIV